MPKKRSAEERSIDHASQQLLLRADQLGLDTAFSRADAMAACPIGAGVSGLCCKNCFMGPCRLTKEVAQKAIQEFGQQKGELAFTRRAPKKRQEAWKKYGITPRGIDREV